MTDHADEGAVSRWDGWPVENRWAATSNLQALLLPQRTWCLWPMRGQSLRVLRKPSPQNFLFHICAHFSDLLWFVSICSCSSVTFVQFQKKLPGMAGLPYCHQFFDGCTSVPLCTHLQRQGFIYQPETAKAPSRFFRCIKLRWPFEQVLSLATWKLLHRLISWTFLNHDR